jgi:hypothetical protein
MYNSSESNILSVANNQRILHHFLFGRDTELNDVNVEKRPKTYFPHRTKSSFEYYFGKEPISEDGVQIEIDLTIEFQGTIGVFEGKNGIPKDFNVYQIYHPYLYYHKAKEQPDLEKKIKDIVCVYVVRERIEGYETVKLWAYTFDKPLDITSIRFLRSASYKLIPQI